MVGGRKVVNHTKLYTTHLLGCSTLATYVVLGFGKVGKNCPDPWSNSDLRLVARAIYPQSFQFV